MKNDPLLCGLATEDGTFLGRRTDNQEMVTIIIIIIIIIIIVIIISIMKMKSTILVMIRSYWRVVHIKNYTLKFNFIITIITMMLIMISNENDHDQESLEGCPHIRLQSCTILPLPLCLGHGTKVVVLMMLTMRMMYVKLAIM